MQPPRRAGRILAMQALCQGDVQGDASFETLDAIADLAEEPPRGADYAAKLVNGFGAARKSVDKRLTAASEKWDLSRISPVERNIMRVAVVELLGNDVPPKVAINEAIEIAREYGGRESARFVNGVLDAVFKKLAQKGEDVG